jgi:hypothetical protein
MPHISTAYQIAKLNRPMTDLPPLIGVQEANGLEIGRILQSNHACTDICHLIASEMRKNLVKYIIGNDLKVGIITDESTTVSKKEALVIGRLPEFTDANSFFFDLTELDNTRAASTVEMFFSNLHGNGFEDEFACNGASNMLG